MKTPKASKATQAPQCLTIGNATIYRGDSVQLLQQLGLQVDALVTDPPYSSGGMVRGDRMQSTAAKYVQSGHALTAAHNLNFSGDNRDGRSWAFWVSCWVSLVRQALRPGGYAMVFTDWRQLPALTDAFQAGGLVWRGLIPWDKTEASRAPHRATFATRRNMWCGVTMAPWPSQSMAARGQVWCASAWTTGQSST